MALENQNTNPAIKIVFDGLNTHVSELFIQNFSSPDMMNCDLDPVTTIRKRDGIVYLNEPDGTGKIDMLALLYKMSEQRGVLYAQRDNVMSAISSANPSGTMTRVDCPWVGTSMPGATKAGFTYETSLDPADLTTAVYTYGGECLYCTDKNQEPIILTGTLNSTKSAETASSMVVGSNPYPVVIANTGHGHSDFDVFTFDDMSAYPDWADLSYRSFFVEVVNANSFYLLDGKFNRLNGAAGWSSPLSQSYNITSGQFVRWPRGVYSSTAPVRGYPARWVDPTDAWTTGEVPPGPYDWPSHTHYIGQGLGARMFAYGFKLDPDRIDYSQLGVPYNFLKADPYYDTEAESDTAPDQDGGYFYCMRGDGDKVVAVRELMGYIGVFKTMRTVLYTGEIGEWFRVAQEYPVGATNEEAVVKVGNDIYFWSFDGPRRLTPSMEQADLLEGSISAEVIEVAKTINVPLDAKVIARHERLKQRIVWHFPTAGNTENNQCLVYYYPTSADPKGRWALWDGAYCQMSQHVVFENPATGTTSVYGGDNNSKGFLYEMNGGPIDGYSEDPENPGEYTIPVPIDMVYVTKWFDFDTVTTYKRALTLMALYGDDGPGEAKFYIGWDYSPAWSTVDRPISYAPTVGASLWNVSVWNDTADTYGTYWNEGGKSMVEYEAEGLGRIFRFKIEDSSIFPVAVSGLVFGPSRKGTR